MHDMCKLSIVVRIMRASVESPHEPLSSEKLGREWPMSRLGLQTTGRGPWHGCRGRGPPSLSYQAVLAGHRAARRPGEAISKGTRGASPAGRPAYGAWPHQLRILPLRGERSAAIYVRCRAAVPQTQPHDKM